jgi:hypothetical protein
MFALAAPKVAANNRHSLNESGAMIALAKRVMLKDRQSQVSLGIYDLVKK